VTAFVDSETRDSTGVDVRNAARAGASITVRDLARGFGGKPVLRGLELHVPAGQFLAVVGRSGCGKSTLLRLLAGLDRPDHGSILFDNRSGENPKRIARVMYQEPRLLPWATVLANVEVGLGPNPDLTGGRDRAVDALSAVGLADRAEDWPAVLSGGQKQRVALARALVSQPRFLAFDEPLGALDALTRIEMQQLLESVWRRDGFTAVLVTHDVAEALTLADRVVLLDDGKIAQDFAVDDPRPSRRGSRELARLEGQILDHLLSS
jgi:sulfonate transport system ATP-binding protein